MFFWAITTSISSSLEGEDYFPGIVFAGQFGSIAGPLLVSFIDKVPIQDILMLPLSAIFIVPIGMSAVLKFFSRSSSVQAFEQEDRPSVLAGIKLVKANPYALGILGITSLHEIISTIIDFEMKYLASKTFNSPEMFASFMSNYGMTVNIFTLILSLIGTKTMVKKIGIKHCLIIYPSIVCALIVTIFVHPSLGVLFVSLVIFKVFNYGINNPAKEILYIPSDADTRYKAKAWNDTIGPRGAKVIGSLVTNALKHSFNQLLYFGSLFSVLILGFWFYIASRVGQKFNQLDNRNIQNNVVGNK